jgi:hypothetical protein
MATHVIVSICIAVVLSIFLIIYAIIATAKYGANKYFKQVGVLFDELLACYEKNINDANDLWDELRSNMNSDARKIWSEDKLCKKVEYSKNDLDHEIQVHGKFLICIEKLNTQIKLDKVVGCILLYRKYLLCSIEYRESVNVYSISDKDEN